MTFRNESGQTIWFRDAVGKHEVAPGEEFEVVGEQHVAHVQTLITAPAGTLDDLTAFVQATGVGAVDGVAPDGPATTGAATAGGTSEPGDDPAAKVAEESGTPPSTKRR